MEKSVPPQPVVKPVGLGVTPQQPILNPVMKPFPEKKQSTSMIAAFFIVVILLGAGTGWALAKKSGTTTSSEVGVTSKNSVASENEAGINDETAFPDTAEGIVREGGIDGEGTHHLERGTDVTKHVYMSSTVINLQNFVGKKVEIRGQTISGKKAGWLMDVGKVKVIQ